MKSEQDQIKTLLLETISSICRNGLTFHKRLKVQGLLGITLDDQSVFIVQLDDEFNVSIKNHSINNVPEKRDFKNKISSAPPVINNDCDDTSYNNVIIDEVIQDKEMGELCDNEAKQFLPSHLKTEPDSNMYYDDCQIIEADSKSVCNQSEWSNSDQSISCSKVKKFSEGVSTIGYLKMKQEACVQHNDNFKYNYSSADYYLPNINVKYELSDMSDVFVNDDSDDSNKKQFGIRNIKKKHDSHIRQPRRPRESNEKSFICPQCGLSYYFKKHLKYHLNTKHNCYLYFNKDVSNT